MIWLIFTLMIGIAVALAAVPFLRRWRASPNSDPRAKHFAAQLAAIEREAGDGAISEPEAAALKAEAGRRLIAASHASATMEEFMQNPRPLAAVAVAAIVAVAGVSLYVVKGSPETPSTRRAATVPLASAAATSTQDEIGSVDAMIERLKSKLAAAPADADGWRMLGWSYFNLGRYKESADAYAQAVKLQPENSGFQSAYGEALVMTASGFVTPAALTAFDAALTVGTDDPRARFFKALALDQAGDPAAAIDRWIELANSASPDADWRDGLIQRIKERAAETGFDISGRIIATDASLLAGAPSPGPTREQVQAAQAMSAGEQQAMIESMVNRLAARLQDNPDDPDGWIRLIKSRMVLGEKVDAARDLKSALDAFSDRPDTSLRIKSEAAELGVRVD